MAQIKELYSPHNADETMKDVWILLTSGQKKIIVNNLIKEMKQFGYPLSRKQIKYYMNYGPKSTVMWRNILTDDQKRAILTSGK